MKFNMNKQPMRIGELFKFKTKGLLSFNLNKNVSLSASSKLIESILLSIPIGQITIASGPTGGFLVLDGEKRLSIIESFVQNEFELTDLSILSANNGLTHHTLSQNERNKIEDFVLEVNRMGIEGQESYNKVRTQINTKLE